MNTKDSFGDIKETQPDADLKFSGNEETKPSFHTVRRRL